MIQRITSLAALALLTAVALAESQSPKSWFLAGSTPQDYLITLDQSVVHLGQNSALLASKSATPKGFGTLMQTVQAESFQRKRLRFTAYLRSSGVSQWVGLWMRVDGHESSPLAFDNMQDRPIKGDTDWQPYSIVLDVPQDATAISFGVLLSGPGKVWIDSGSLAVVDASVPTTGGPARQLPPHPVNLDFEQ